MKEIYEASFVEREKQIKALETKQISQDDLIKQLRVSNQAIQREIKEAEEQLNKEVEKINAWTLRIRGTGAVGSTDAAVGTNKRSIEENLRILTLLLTRFQPLNSLGPHDPNALANALNSLDPDDPSAVTDALDYLRGHGISADRNEVKEFLSKLKTGLNERLKKQSNQ
jgi:SMC interacting uncharacterized protein involved in chromosome segregation